MSICEFCFIFENFDLDNKNQYVEQYF